MTTEIDNLLDSTLDDLEDLPSFANYPPGVHKVLASLGMKEINDKKAVELSLKGIETIELVDAAGTEAIKAGDESSMLFMLDNEFGRGKLKAVLAALADTIGSRNNREIIEGTKDVECLIVTSLRKDKNDPDKSYMNIKELQVV